MNKIINFIENKIIYCILILSFFMYSSLTQNTKVISILIWPIVFLSTVILIFRLFHIKDYFFNIMHIMIGLFLISYIISAFINIEYGFYQNLRTAILMVVIIGIVFTKKQKYNTMTDIIKCSRLYVAISSILSLTSILIFNFNQIFIHFSEKSILITGLRWGRLRGLYNDYNYGAFINVLAILMLVFAFINNKKIINRILYLILMAIDFVFIVLSDSRGAILALIISLIVYLVLTLRNVLKIKIKNLIIVLIVPLTIFGVYFSRIAIREAFINIYDNYEERVDIKIAKLFSCSIKISKIDNYLNDKDYSDERIIPINNPDDIFDRGYSTKNDYSNRRLDLWKNSLLIFKKNMFFGVSFENFESYCHKYMPNAYLINNGYKEFDNFHNIFFNVLASQGLLGVIVFLMIILYLFFKSLKLVINIFKNKSYSNENVFFISIIITTFICSMLIGDIVYYISPSTIICWFVLGYLSNIFMTDESFKNCKPIRAIKKIFRITCVRIFNLFPIKNNKIIFSSFSGKGFGDNPKYILLELQKANKNYDLVWVLSNTEDKNTLPKGVRYTKYNSIKYFYELCTSKVWVDNHRKIIDISKRKNQYYIQAWHGAFGLKKVEKDAEAVLNPKYIKQAKHDSKMIDLMISNSAFCTKLYKRAFWYSGDVLECGTPRNDILIHGDSGKLKTQIRKRLKLNNDEKIVLYAPTFRRDENIDCYNIDFKRLVKSLSKKFDGEWKVLVRLHPNISHKSKQLALESNILDVSDYGDMYELMLISDILISDYSGVMFDFSLQNKPVFLYASDIDNYLDDRGFYFEYSELPYSYAQNNDELIKNIEMFNEKKYHSALKKFYSSIGSVESGNASKKVADKICKIIEGENNGR